MRITDDILYVGVNDHNIDLFEGQYIVPNGMAYNSYVINDEKIAVMDTVDAAFGDEWLKNIADVLKNSNAFAVDVSGGVETEGLKDPEKIAAFIAEVRGDNDDKR